MHSLSGQRPYRASLRALKSGLSALRSVLLCWDLKLQAKRSSNVVFFKRSAQLLTVSIFFGKLSYILVDTDKAHRFSVLIAFNNPTDNIEPSSPFFRMFDPKFVFYSLCFTSEMRLKLCLKL